MTKSLTLPIPCYTVLISEYKSDLLPETWMEQGASPIFTHLYRLNKITLDEILH